LVEKHILASDKHTRQKENGDGKNLDGDCAYKFLVFPRCGTGRNGRKFCAGMPRNSLLFDPVRKDHDQPWLQDHVITEKKTIIQYKQVTVYVFSQANQIFWTIPINN
jgi:hypothetical protein